MKGMLRKAMVAVATLVGWNPGPKTFHMPDPAMRPYDPRPRHRGGSTKGRHISAAEAARRHTKRFPPMVLHPAISDRSRQHWAPKWCSADDVKARWSDRYE